MDAYYFAEQDKAAARKDRDLAETERMEERMRNEKQKSEFKRIKGKLAGPLDYARTLTSSQSKTKRRPRRRRRTARPPNARRRFGSLRTSARVAR